MIYDHEKHEFDNCPTCKGLAIWLNHNRLTPKEANRQQIAELVDYCDSNGIHVTRKERKAAA